MVKNDKKIHKIVSNKVKIHCRLWLSSCQRPVLNESCKATVVERKNGNVKLETTKRGGTADDKSFSERSHEPPSALLIWLLSFQSPTLSPRSYLPPAVLVPSSGLSPVTLICTFGDTRGCWSVFEQTDLDTEFFVGLPLDTSTPCHCLNSFLYLFLQSSGDYFCFRKNTKNCEFPFVRTSRGLMPQITLDRSGWLFTTRLIVPWST